MKVRNCETDDIQSLIFILFLRPQTTLNMISKWHLKAIVQKSISFLPKNHKVNYLFQKYVTKGLALNDTYFRYKIESARDHIAFFKQHSKQAFEESTVLELGTGWYPIVPIAMFLNGFSDIKSIDIYPWMNKQSILQAIAMFKTWHDDKKLLAYLPDMDTKRWETLMRLLENGDQLHQTELMQAIHLNSTIQDARTTNFKHNSIDFICSNNTFEHIPKVVLTDILKEFKRIAKQGGVMSHFIDMTDHFAHFDPSINVFNFLQFSERRWQFIDNSIQPQNRMRFIDYKELYTELQLPISATTFNNGELSELKSIKVHKEFQHRSLEELVIIHGYIVSVM